MFSLNKITRETHSKGVINPEFGDCICIGKYIHLLFDLRGFGNGFIQTWVIDAETTEIKSKQKYQAPNYQSEIPTKIGHNILKCDSLNSKNTFAITNVTNKYSF